jgi:ATP-dependent helicase/nuclease subunit A
LGFNGVLKVLKIFYADCFMNGSVKPGTKLDFLSLHTSLKKTLAKELESVFTQIEKETTNPKWLTYAGDAKKIIASSSSEDLINVISNLGRKPTYKEDYFSSDLRKDIDECLKEIKKFDSYLGYNKDHWPLFEEANRELFNLAQDFCTRLVFEKCRQGNLSSLDLEIFTLLIIRKHPEISELFALDWDAWFLDEYQDTSPAQVEILKAFTSRAPVYVVGDPQQSIYLFRGADVRVFFERQNEVKAHGGKLSELKTNYRSRPELLKCINDILPCLGEGFKPMDPRTEKPDSKDTVLFVGIEEAQNEDESKNIKPKSLIASFVNSKVGQGAAYGDFAILARTNDVLIEVATELEAQGIPTEIHSASGYYRRREILDIFSLLKFIVNPHDNLNFIRLVRSPWFRILDQDIFTFVQKRDKDTKNYFDLATTELKGHPVLVYLNELQIRARTKGILLTLIDAVREVGMIDFSHKHDASGRREANIWKFISQLQEAERAPGFSYTEFILKTERAQEDGSDDTDAVSVVEPNRVALMTIHKAKGLKFKHVIIARMDKEPKFASSRAHEYPLIYNKQLNQFNVCLPVPPDDKKVHTPVGTSHLSTVTLAESEEFSRLLYVALTRAEHSLFLHAQGKKGNEFPKRSWMAMVLKAKPVREALSGEYNGPDYRTEIFTYNKIVGAKSRSVTYQGILVNRYEFKSLSALKKRLSVTALLEENPASEGQSQVLSPQELEKSLRAPALGTKIHKLFEALKYDINLNPKDWVEDKNLIEPIERTLIRNDPPLKKIILNGHVEWGFQALTQRGVIEGQIDLWGVVDGVLWVIDYKSGSDKYLDKAFKQLEIYAYFLMQSNNFAKANLGVVYPLTGNALTRTFSMSADFKKQYGF